MLPSHSRARDAIRRGCVHVSGIALTKAGHLVDEHDEIRISGDPGLNFVSRGALKLAAGLEAFSFPVENKSILDVGASTGGFTDLLLKRGARKVYCVDVGSGQLHERLVQDPRVMSFEQTDARALTPDRIGEQVDAIVADVSFISLTKILPVPLSLAAPAAWLIALIKPKFEVGQNHISKTGLVKDEAIRLKAMRAVQDWVGA